MDVEGLFQRLSPCHTARASVCPLAGSVWQCCAALLHIRSTGLCHTASGSSTKSKPCPRKRSRQGSAVQRQTQRGKAAALRSQLLQLRPAARVWDTRSLQQRAAAHRPAQISAGAPQLRKPLRGALITARPRGTRLCWASQQHQHRAALHSGQGGRFERNPLRVPRTEGRTQLRLQLWERSVTRTTSSDSSPGPQLHPHRGSAGVHGPELREDPQGTAGSRAARSTWRPRAAPRTAPE